MTLKEAMRRALVLISMGCGIIMDAYVFGHTSTMVAGLYAEKDELQYTDDDISWITSIMFPSMVLGTMMATVVTEKIGRRFTITIFSIPVILHWIMLYFAKDKNLLIIIRFFMGLGYGGVTPIIFVSTAEYSSPKMRGVNISIVTNLGPSIGGTLGYFLGIGFHWRTAALAAVIPSVVAAVLPLLCVESPSWLASKGEFVKCEEAFRALHGYTPSSDKELDMLLKVEMKKYKKTDNKTQIVILIMKRLKIAATKKFFWNIMLLSLIAQIYKTLCKIMGVVFGVLILQHITGQSDIMIYATISNSVMFVACVIAPLISSKINIRTTLFAGGVINNVVLATLSIMLYIRTVNNTFFTWINITLNSLNGFIVHVSVFPILEMLPSELYPLEIKSACVSLMGLAMSIFMFVYIKVMPSLIVQINYYGVFMIHVIGMSVCIAYLWIKLPETKGKTLQEIELKLKNEQLDVDLALIGDQKEVVEIPDSIDDHN